MEFAIKVTEKKHGTQSRKEDDCGKVGVIGYYIVINMVLSTQG